MKNKILFGISAILLALLIIQSVSAIVSFYQETIFLPDNPHITRTTNSVFWILGKYDGVKDIITDDSLLEVEIDYSMYPKTWNEKNINYEIENCTLTINYFENKLNESYVFYNETISKTDADLMGAKYFVRVPQKDGISVFMDCYFNNTSSRILSTPTELDIKLPTYECKSCQYYNWVVQQRSVEKAKVVGNNAVTIWDYIKELISLNFEIILALFWLLIIVIFLGAIGLIFIGIYWGFLWLRHLAKGI
jgi:hypothetical protein